MDQRQIEEKAELLLRGVFANKRFELLPDLDARLAEVCNESHPRATRTLEWYHAATCAMREARRMSQAEAEILIDVVSEEEG